ncbi:family 16 glycoside hydrolase [Xanthovirga aplysinae]|uniref:family 16 glycoside hydrolase n=1 Tax=Xanthovirga aplysinae TaxID=2529853 RepID=UPI0012BBD04B|nr:family 16 glycoside hydrolase [Xanthovirga aplysinae]MTI32629.1 DUF1080 domain-containing protein [Xanthovirga aplysinae]
MKFLLNLLLFVVTSTSGFSQAINLAEQLKWNNITIVNREVSNYETDGIELNAREGNGLAILDQVEFKTGTIKLEIKGENAPGRSFVGFAFNIENDTTYEAVYFRPFNFIAKEAERKSHMMQYIYHPVYTWYKLREERTDEFEREMQTPPKPENWFKVKIEVKDKNVVVFVNGQPEPDMKIERLTSSTPTKIGLWVGHGSSGRFRNLIISKEQ